MKVRALVSSLLLVSMSMGALGARLQQFAASPQLLKPPLPLTPSEIEIYKGAQSLIDWTPRQIHDCPFLRQVRPTGSQGQLPKVLERVGQTVTLLYQDFPRIACDEDIFSKAYHRKSVHHKFRYIVMLRPVDGVPGFEEYRTDLKGNPLDASSLSGLSVMFSNYTSNCLYFSPADLRDNRFRHFGMQRIRQRECHVVGFAQEPERVRRVGTFLYQGKTAAMLFQGLAWIDSQTFQLLRIKTWLLAPRGDIGMNSQTSTVDFYPVQPSGSGRVLWLPRDVTAEVVYLGMEVRNTHRYSNFKLFRVETTIKPEG